MGEGKAFVTGVSRGLGAAVALRLLEDGWTVVGTSRRRSPEVEQLEGQYRGRFRFQPADLGLQDDVDRLIQETQLLEGYQAFISNAGVGVDGLLTLQSPELIRHGMEVNLIAAILLARAAIKGMMERGGSLIFVASIAAQTGFAGLSTYGAAKAGLVGFSRAVAREYGSRNIRSNCILPGFLETEMTAGLDEDLRAQLTRRTPLGRLGRCEDVLGVVRLLLSDAGGHITGTEIVVDGGMRA